jgi:FimV-like protein
LTKEPQRTDLALQLLDVLGKQGDVSAYEAQENSLRVAGFDPQQLHDIRNRYPKMESAALPVAAVPPVIVASAETPTSGTDEFQLNLDELSMDSSWDLVSPTQETASTPKPVFTSSLHVLPEASDEPDLEWLDDPQAPMLDDAFLDEFSEPNQPLAPEPHKPDNAGKLEQAQTCIDDGDLDSAIELLNQLLKEGDEPLKQTARNLLAGIR